MLIAALFLTKRSLKQIDHRQNDIKVPLLLETLQNHQLLVPIILNFPSLRFFVLLNYHLFVFILLPTLVFLDSNKDDPEPTPPQKFTPNYLVLPFLTLYSRLIITQPILLLKSHLYLFYNYNKTKLKSSIPSQLFPNISAFNIIDSNNK